MLHFAADMQALFTELSLARSITPIGLNCLCAITIYVVGSVVPAKNLCVTAVQTVYDRLSLADTEAGENLA